MYSNMPKARAGNRQIDLRSDTVTRPSPGMRKAMAEADVGDDVYGDDPTVRALEERTAELLGKEAGLFVTSGTQSNLIALLNHCGRGDEYIGGVGYHIPKYEAAGAAVLGGISPCHLHPNENGALEASEVEAAIRPDDPHFAISKLICVENTFNGRVVDQEDMLRVAQVAKANGLALHLDGARLMNAAVKSGRPAKELTEPMDSVSLCLSKGLGTPVGSMLCGSHQFIEQARRNRKILGGGMRQAGVLAACGLYALDHHIDRLEEDHEKAAVLAKRLTEIEGIEIDMKSVQTNMVWMKVVNKGSRPLSEHMMERHVIVGDPDATQTVRLVAHLDVESSDIDVIVDGFSSWLGQTNG